MKLFRPELGNTQEDRIQIGQTSFEFLERSAKAGAQLGRNFLESNIKTFPQHKRVELTQRLRAKDETTYHSAFFEIFLARILIDLGFSLEFEGEDQYAPSNPDFFITADNYRIAVEATAIYCDRKSRQHTRRLDELCMLASKHIKIPGYYITIRNFSDCKQAPSPKKFAEFLNREFRALSATSGQGTCPDFEYIDNQAGLRVTGGINRLDSKRFLTNVCGITTSTAFSVGPEKLVKTISNKKTQHRSIKEPLLIAINPIDWLIDPDQEDTINALYGCSLYGREWQNNTSPLQQSDVGNCIWPASSTDDTCNRVHGVLLFRECFPWSTTKISGELWLAPKHDLFGFEKRWPFDKYWTDADSKLMHRRISSAQDLS